MSTRNTVLKSKLGIEFEFKNSLTPYLELVISNPLILDYSVAGNTPTIRQAAIDKVGLVGSTMAFEYKASVYGALKLVNDAIVESEDVALEDKNSITALTMLVSRYVGMEGDGDFHFMVAVYTLSEKISEVLDITDA